MTDHLKFKAEIEFDGSIAEFEELANSILKANCRIKVDEFPFPWGGKNGGWPVPVERLIKIEKYLQEQPRIRLIKDLAGGIRISHIHLKDEIVMVDRKIFRDIMGDVARELAESLADEVEYVQAVNAINHLSHKCK